MLQLKPATARGGGGGREEGGGSGGLGWHGGSWSPVLHLPVDGDVILWRGMG